jgi:DNA end-binding protein Ku
MSCCTTQSGRVALTRVVIARRERAVVLMPMDRGLVAHTMHEERDVNSPRVLFDQVPREKPAPDMVKLAVQLVDRQTGAFNPADMEDRYEARLRAVIEAKLKGEGVEPAAEADLDRGNVVDLMAALKRSLGQTAGGQAAKGQTTGARGGRGAASRPAVKKTEKAPGRESPSATGKRAASRRKSA